MKKIVFLGFLGKEFGDFLVNFNNFLSKQNTELSVISFMRHEKAFLNEKCNFDYFNFDYFPEADGLLGQAEFWFNIFPADMYIIWNGYHNIYANFRNYLKVNNIPFLLTEYSSINDCFYFDIGLHSEATKPLVKINNNLSTDFLNKYIKPRYPHNNLNIELLNILKKKKEKKILFVGMWDEAAGLNECNNEESKKSLSPLFNSSSEAAKSIINTKIEDSIIILKSHPYDNKKESLKVFDDKEKIFYIENEIEIDELIKLSDLVITIASTVSILATYNLKPLIMLGNTYLTNFDYSLKLNETGTNLEKLIKESFDIDDSFLKEKREEFFREYIFNYEIYTHDKELIFNGVKSCEKLCNKCISIIETTNLIQRNNFQEKISIIESFSNYEIKLVEDKEKAIQTQSKMIDEREQTINGLNQLVEDKEKAIQTQSKMIDEREQTINGLNQLVEDKERKVIYLENKYKLLEIIFKGKK